MGYNKIVYGGEAKLDLTGDTVVETDLRSGITAHNRAGEQITGTNTFDADTSDATALDSQILQGQSAYARGQKLNGTMPNLGSQTGEISAVNQAYSIAAGYHDGAGNVTIAQTEQAKLIPENIRQGVNVLGVEGTMSGSEDVRAQSKTATPKTTQQTILPDEGYNSLTEVTIEAIPYSETPNDFGGTTVTIG